MQKKNLTPFLKWPGGKRWLVHRHAALLPTHYNRYIEPFLGGGAVYFHLQPSVAILGDINPDVVGAYVGIQRDWRRIQRSLEYKQRAHNTRDESGSDQSSR